MRSVDGESSIELDDDDEMGELFGVEGDLEPVSKLGDDSAVDPEVALEAEAEVEPDDELLEPDFAKLGRPTRRFEDHDAELEALIDADMHAEDEDEFELAMLQEMGIEIGDDSSMSMLAMGDDSADSESFDDEVAA